MAAKALSFDVGDYVVYPKHGVGRVVELQSTEIAGTHLDAPAILLEIRNSVHLKQYLDVGMLA